MQIYLKLEICCTEIYFYYFWVYRSHQHFVVCVRKVETLWKRPCEVYEPLSLFSPSVIHPFRPFSSIIPASVVYLLRAQPPQLHLSKNNTYG